MDCMIPIFWKATFVWTVQCTVSGMLMSRGITGGCQSGGGGELGDGLQGRGVDELEVIDAEISRSVFEKVGFYRGEIDGGGLLAGLDEVSGGGEGALDARGVGVVVGNEFAIAGGEGEAVVLADGRMTNNFDWYIEIADHAIDEGELLEVFFAEK